MSIRTFLREGHLRTSALECSQMSGEPMNTITSMLVNDFLFMGTRTSMHVNDSLFMGTYKIGGSPPG
jgi:hypothetical protein